MENVQDLFNTNTLESAFSEVRPGPKCFQYYSIMLAQHNHKKKKSTPICSKCNSHSTLKVRFLFYDYLIGTPTLNTNRFWSILQKNGLEAICYLGLLITGSKMRMDLTDYNWILMSHQMCIYVFLHLCLVVKVKVGAQLK